MYEVALNLISSETQCIYRNKGGTKNNQLEYVCKGENYFS